MTMFSKNLAGPWRLCPPGYAYALYTFTPARYLLQGTVGQLAMC